MCVFIATRKILIDHTDILSKDFRIDHTDIKSKDESHGNGVMVTCEPWTRYGTVKQCDKPPKTKRKFCPKRFRVWGQPESLPQGLLERL